MTTTLIQAPPNLRADQFVQQRGQCLLIDDKLVNVLGDIPTQVHTPVRNDDGSVRIERQIDSLLVPANGAVFPNSGLLPILAEMARVKGVEWDQTRFDRRVAPLNLAENQLLPPGMAEFLSSNSRGRLRVGPGVRISALIAGISLAAPSARIAVLASHRETLNRMEAEWSELLPKRGVSVANVENGAVSVCTWLEAADLPGEAQFHECDIVIALDASEIAHERAQLALCADEARFRLFAFERAGRRPAPRESDLMMAALGPAVFEMPTTGVGAAHVQVALTTSKPAPLDSAIANVELHRAGYWRNPQRNRRIARLAEALAAGNAEVIERHTEISEWWHEMGGRPQKVTVRCANREHMRAIRRNLKRTDDVLLTDSDRNLTEETLDVVIWATGGPGIYQGPTFTSVREPRRRVLMVDFHDRHHRQLLRWSESRRHEYEARGWFPVGVDETTGRVQAFLNARPSNTHQNGRRSR